MTFPIEGTLAAIAVYYHVEQGRKYRIVGLKFTTSSGQDVVQVGESNGIVEEHLQFSDVSVSIHSQLGRGILTEADQDDALLAFRHCDNVPESFKGQGSTEGFRRETGSIPENSNLWFNSK